MTRCDCIQKVTAALRLKYGPTAYLETKQTINFKTNETAVALPPAYFRYNKLKANGQPEARETRKFIMFSYCPFCGKKDE